MKWHRLVYSALLTLSFAILLPTQLTALTFPLPKPGNDVVGSYKIVQSKKGDTLLKVARQYEMGVDDILEANKSLAPKGIWSVLKKDTAIIIPSEFILPNTPREGIVINLPEKRLYLYQKDEPVVMTEPVAIGIYGWPTPLLSGSIIEKAKNPTWHIPESIQIEREMDGLPAVTFIPPGPQNPLGKYAMRLSNRSILIHSTNAINSIGRRASHGCIRMYPEDAEELFYSTDINMPVRIINQPYKAGWSENHIYLEIHPSLLETRGTIHERVEEAFNLLMDLTNNNKQIINWAAVETALVKQTGIPEMVSK